MPTIILITGANSGVGYAAAKVIASSSFEYYVLMAGRNMAKVDAARSELEASGTIKGKLFSIRLDVTDESTIKQAASKVEKQFGRVDVLINNAGVGNRDPDLETRLRANFDTNVVGPALVSQASRPLLLKSTNPRSIYISSGSGSIERASHRTKQVLPNAESYSVSKAALNMLALNEKIDYGAQGLKVFVFCPGFVVSNIRGSSKEERSGGGMAGDPDVSAMMLLDMIEERRDEDIGKFIHRDGIYPW
ncbi:hypothetical protein LTR64_002703 [Lithohypha guttulata]|uniref:uncharacterized protein n=1 Tax=Lithohypha guttulata TaxID=1690604 RepID=UPI00315DB78B